MIVRTMKCYDCKREFLEKMTNDEYSEYIQKRKLAEKKGVEHGWFCNDCVNKKCVMCKRGTVSKYIPAKKDGKITKKIPACQNCFDRFRAKLGFSEEIAPELLEPLPNITHEEWVEFMEKSRNE